jgi:hypothetical protein
MKPETPQTKFAEKPEVKKHLVVDFPTQLKKYRGDLDRESFCAKFFFSLLSPETLKNWELGLRLPTTLMQKLLFSHADRVIKKMEAK